MKKILILLFSFMISFNSYGETKYYYYSNDQIKSEVNYKEGKKDGKYNEWHNNGQKKAEGNYKNNKVDGKWIWWWEENGQIEAEAIYKDGDLVNKSLFNYHENGQLESKKYYKDNRLNATFWYKNGQKFIDSNYKDKKPDGKWTFWHRNGQKDEERNYKDGDLVDKTIFKYGYFTGHLRTVKKYKDGKCISGC